MSIENIKNDLTFDVINKKIVATRTIVDEYDEASSVKLISEEEQRINYMYQTIANPDKVWKAEIEHLNQQRMLDKKEALDKAEVDKYRIGFDNQIKQLKTVDIVWVEKEMSQYEKVARALGLSWSIDKIGFIPEE